MRGVQRRMAIARRWMYGRYVPLERSTFEDMIPFTHRELSYSLSSSARQTRTRPGPTVWCSWCYYGDGFSQAELEENLAFFERTSFPTDVILIDECWDRRWGDWEPNARWPDLHGIAERIRGAGYEPGIWTCCFLAEPRAAIRHRNPHWLLRDGRGNPIRFAMAGMSSYVLDPTHPEVQEHLVALYRRLTREWGFIYHKIDSMGATEVTSWTLRKSHVSVDIEWPWNRPLCVTILDAQGRSHDHTLGSGRHRL